MELDGKYFFLNRESIFIKGRNKGAIYNLYTGDVFSIDKDFSELLNLCEKERMLFTNAVSKIRKNGELNDNQINSFIKEMVKLDLGELYDNKIFIEKVKPTSSKKERLSKMEPSTIEFLWLKINNECNLHCLHCKGLNGFYGRCGCTILDEISNNKLEINEWEDIIEEAKLFNCQSIQFIGGEPLSDKDKVFHLIDYSNQLKIASISLVTNGILLSSEIIKWLVGKNVHLILPFHSWQSSIHDSITGFKDSHKRVLEAIKVIQKCNGNFSVEMVITKPNQNDSQKTKEFLKSLQIEDVNSQTLRTNQEKIFASELAKKVYRTEALFPNISKNQYFKNKEGNPCWDGKVAVLPNGDVLPCIMAYSNKIGNIKELSFRQIIRTSDIRDKYWDLSKDKIDICCDCEYRYACSDCRVMESLDGSLTGKNKYCTYNPSTGNWENLKE